MAVLQPDEPRPRVPKIGLDEAAENWLHGTPKQREERRRQRNAERVDDDEEGNEP